VPFSQGFSLDEEIDAGKLRRRTTRDAAAQLACVGLLPLH